MAWAWMDVDGADGSPEELPGADNSLPMTIGQGYLKGPSSLKPVIFCSLLTLSEVQSYFLLGNGFERSHSMGNRLGFYSFCWWNAAMKSIGIIKPWTLKCTQAQHPSSAHVMLSHDTRGRLGLGKENKISCAVLDECHWLFMLFLSILYVVLQRSSR